MNSVTFIAQFRLFSHEGQIKPASNSEIRRWIEAKAIKINGEELEIEEIDFPVFSLVLFPKGKRITLL